ncbi:hypothetical protein D3C73_1239420 [compost metagenome]
MSGHVFALSLRIRRQRGQQRHTGRREKRQRKAAGCPEHQKMPRELRMGLQQQNRSGRRKAEDNIAAAAIAVNQHASQQIAGKVSQRIHAHHPAYEGRTCAE